MEIEAGEVTIIVDIGIHLDMVVVVVVIIIVAVHHHHFIHIHQEIDEGDIHHRQDIQDLVHVHFPLVSIHLNVRAEFLCLVMLERIKKISLNR